MRYRVEYFGLDSDAPCHVKCVEVGGGLEAALRSAEEGFVAAKAVFHAQRYVMRDEAGEIIAEGPGGP